MTKKIILVAEDDNLIARAYTDGLTASGYNVIRAADGEETLEQIKNKKPSAVLLDLRMPKKDGFQVLEELNTSGLIKNLTVIVASNLDQNKDIARCIQLGAKGYIIKSNSSIEDIIEAVEKY